VQGTGSGTLPVADAPLLGNALGLGATLLDGTGLSLALALPGALVTTGLTFVALPLPEGSATLALRLLLGCPTPVVLGGGATGALLAPDTTGPPTLALGFVDVSAPMLLTALLGTTPVDAPGPGSGSVTPPL
jgi:hypothetical protein